jgi:IclR family transcriptional regulator, pca regulon regulatory protein
MKKDKIVNSLIKGLNILEVFTPSQSSLSFQELCKKTGFPKTTVFRFLRTLTSHDYLSLDSRTKKYFLGPRVMSLGFAVLSGMDLRNVAYPYLEELARTTDQNVHLAILDKIEVVVIERIKRWQILDINIPIGGRLNCYQTSTGRAILAFLSQEKFLSILSTLLKDREVVKHIGPKGEKLIKTLKEVRQNGYALSDEEFIKGVRTIAAPIFNAQGDVEGAVYMVVFSQMKNREEMIKQYTPLLMDTARKISTARGLPAEGYGYSRATQQNKTGWKRFSCRQEK